MSSLAESVLRTRLANQLLTAPAASTPEEVVGHLLAVQAQDAPLARLAIAQRAGCHVRDVEAAIDAGRIVRTHLLRPTWHYVLRDDLGWLLELTGARLISGIGSRLVRLGLPPEVLTAGMDAVLGLVATRPATRAEVTAHLAAVGLLPRDPELGMRVTHVLMHAEARGLIASGPLSGGEHTYAPWDAPTPGRPREAAVSELTRRFVGSHGPVSVKDLMRWVNLTKTEIVRALAALGDSIDSLDADGVRLYFNPDGPAPAQDAAAWCLSTFDEAFLSYRDAPWPRAPGHPLADAPYRWSEAGGGPVLDDLQDVGSWKRTLRPGRLILRLDLASGLSDAACTRVLSAAEDAAARLCEPDTDVRLEDGPVPFGVRSPRSTRTSSL